MKIRLIQIEKVSFILILCIALILSAAGSLGIKAYAMTPTVTHSGTSDLLSVAYGNGLYVAVGGNGNVSTSPDGLTWAQRNSGVSNCLRTVIYVTVNGANEFLAGGDSGYLATSVDGINWTKITTNTTNNINTLVYAKGILILGCNNGTVGRTTDLVNFTWQTVNGGNYVHGLWNGTYFCVANSEYNDAWIIYSSDGLSWSFSWGDSVYQGLQGFAYNSSNSMYAIATLDYGVENAGFLQHFNTDYSYNSTDLSTYYYSITCLHGYFVASGNLTYSDKGYQRGGYIVTSKDGRTWKPYYCSSSFNTIYAYASSNTTLVGVGAGGQIITMPADIFAPVVSLSESNMAITKSVDILANATDDTSCTTYWSKSSTAGISGTQFDKKFTVTSGGTYYVCAADPNLNTTTAAITVNNIDDTPPTISLSQNTTGWTNGAVTITAAISDVNTYTSYWSTDQNAKDTGTKFSSSFSVTDNGTYYVYAVDAAGNGATKSITISNIDKVAPVLTLSENTADPAKSVTITATATDDRSLPLDREVSIIFYYSLNQNGPYTCAEGSSGGCCNYFTVTTNGTYYAYIDDSAGNRSYASITVNNIDNTPPAITLTPSTTDATRSLTITANVADKAAYKTYWSTDINAGHDAPEFSGSFTVTANGTYYVDALDSLGNENRTSITISNIDTTPEITLAESTTSATNQPITVKTNVDASSSVKTYWSTDPNAKTSGTEFNGSFVTVSNGTYYVYAIDSVGSDNTKSITVSNIDTTPPTVNITLDTHYTNKPVAVTVAVDDASIVTTYYSTTESAESSGTQFSGSFNAQANGTYYIYAVDAAGNSTTKTITVGNIDTTAPTLSLTQSTTDITQYATIVATTSDNNGTVTTYWSTSPTAAVSGKQFTNSFNAASNETYYVTAVDQAGNTVQSSIVISNINIRDNNGNPSTGDQPTNKTGNDSNVPIVATTDPIVFRVIVPISLPAAVDKSGNITTATNAVVTNESSYGCVKVNQINAIGINDWSLYSYESDFGNMKVNAKQFGFTMNNNEANISTGVIDCSNMNAINIDNSMPINYMIKMPPQAYNLDSQTICNVVFLIDWYK